MAKFHGVVGYGESVETAADVFKDLITERVYFGEVVRNNRRLQADDNVNEDISVSNQISVVADEYATKHFFAIKFLEWEGVAWTVTNVEVRAPRLLLTLGTVYNGPRASEED